jgi:adenine deaminase
MQNEIITKIGSAELHSKDGIVSASLDYDIWKVAAFDRIHGTNRHSIGFLENFGAEIGAFASTWSFHENDMIVIGSNDSDMAIASNHLIKNQGGLVVVKSGKILASLPLQFAGIISTDSFEMVSSNFQKIISTIVDLGCKFTRPHLIPLFLPFLALPSIRILSAGIIDVKKRSYIQPIN